MPEEINIHAKSDRELLILIAERVNNMKDHDKRIYRLELWRTGLAATTAAVGVMAAMAWEGVKWVTRGK